MSKNKTLLYHGIAILTVLIWGTTFVCTKVLINTGLSPVEILLYRFVLAYGCLLAISHSRIWASTAKDELLLLLCGLSGGSLYFIAENTALSITMASNVSLLICTSPIFTTILARIFIKEPFKRNLLYGSLVALLGVGLVVFNGSVLLRINPLGDLLTLVAAILWAFYCLILKRLSRSYTTLFITRKVFFYGILSLLLYFLLFPFPLHYGLLKLPIVYLNLLFLSVVASMLGYIMWNAAVGVLGASKTANYIYIIPLITLLTSAIVLSEPITIVSGIGALAIIGGVYVAERN